MFAASVEINGGLQSKQSYIMDLVVFVERIVIISLHERISSLAAAVTVTGSGQDK